MPTEMDRLSEGRTAGIGRDRASAERSSSDSGSGSGSGSGSDPARPPAADRPGPTADVPSLSGLDEAEALLVDFIATEPKGDENALDALCLRHPEHEARLRRLHAEWAQLDRLLASASSGSSRVARGRRARNEPTPDPRPLDADPLDPRTLDPRPLDDLLDQLAARASPASRYVVQREIARGGMGTVYTAWDRTLRRLVAMKVLRDDRARRRGGSTERERVLGRFFEEAQITGQLEHPGIVPVHEIGLDDHGRLFFTMPLVRGVELGKVIELARGRREGWTRTRAIGVFLKVCEAVAYAHAKGVVHRDLKPSNVMVGPFGETYVMDWGLARLLSREEDSGPDPRSLPRERDLVDTDIRERLVGPTGERSTPPPDSPFATQRGTVLGTPAYMAPEQAGGRSNEVGPRADVYAIGAMLYELLTGRMPYAASLRKPKPEDLLAARLRGPPAPVLELAPEAPPDLVAICEKAMASDPERRYATALELAADLEAWLDRRPVKAFESSPLYALGLALRRNRRTAIALGFACLVALAFGVRDVVLSRQRARTEAGLREQTERAADVNEAKVLLAEEPELHPATPEVAPRMAEWLARADGVLARAERDSALLAAGVAGIAPAAPSSAANLQHLRSAREGVAARLASARTLVERTIGARREQWDAAIDGVASLPIYGGLRLRPQRGLVPLQRNPRSGLWEFWVDGTGAEPRIRDPRTGEIEADPASALVLVLIPGGRATLGSPDKEMLRQPNEGLRSVELAPYFLGKSEVPQAVWTRVMGDNPSECVSEETYAEGVPATPLLPVESITWFEARRFLERAALAFPTESQWEHAARCGGAEPYVFGPGDGVRSLDGRENVCDLVTARAAGVKYPLPWDDGYRGPSPVMSYDPNAFGLHDLLGNVTEWCGDGISHERAALIDGDGSCADASDTYRVIRGGHYQMASAAYLRIAFRSWDRPRVTNRWRGLRVARAVE
jgi:serine/threonine protein kinase/formylglycine-generating enzyme required for sulfatase activity